MLSPRVLKRAVKCCYQLSKGDNLELLGGPPPLYTWETVCSNAQLSWPRTRSSAGAFECAVEELFAIGLMRLVYIARILV